MYSVLIIDDDKLARKGLIAMTDWQRCGMKVAGDVANGKLAMDFIRDHAVDLAVVDLEMPVMTGLEFIRESSKLYPEMQYVVLSFHEDFEYVQSALRLGALDYISKLRIEEDCTQSFLAIRQMLDKRRSNQPLKQEDAGVPADAYEAICAKWRRLYWVYNRYTFERMLDKLARSGMNLPQMERLIALVANDVNAAFPGQRALPYLSDTGEIRACMRQLRSDLLAEVETQPDLSSLTGSILYAAYYAQNHMSERLKEQQVAQLVGLSRGYFSQSFRQLVGATFGNFLRGIRMDRAKDLMREGVSPSEASLAVGYDDFKYFQQIFRTLTGESCSDFCRRISPNDVQEVD